jgi:hypothetical protein
VLLEGAPALTKVAEQLQPADFFVDGHRLCLEAMLRVAAAGGAIDHVTLAEELRRAETYHQVGGPTQLALLMEEASITPHLAEYIAIVREKSALRDTIKTASQLIHAAFEDQARPQGLLDQARARLEAIAARATVAESLIPARSVAELLAATFTPPEFHLAERIPRNGITFLVGDSEAYKSWFILYAALCIAAGRPMFDQLAVRQAPVLLISEENGEIEDRRRLDLLARGMNFTGALPLYIASEVNFRFDDPARYAAMRAFVTDKAIALVIVDSFVRVHRLEEKDAGQMNALYMDRMKPLIKAGVDLVLLHHKRKLPAGLHGAAATQASSDNDDIRGSGDLRAAAHAVIFLKPQGKSAAVVRQNKARGFKKPEPFAFSITDLDAGGVLLKHEGKPEDMIDKTAVVRAAILEYAAAHAHGFFRPDVIKALKGTHSKKVIDPVLKLLSKDGVPLKEDEVQQGRTKKLFYTLVDADPEPATPGDDDDDVPF